MDEYDENNQLYLIGERTVLIDENNQLKTRHEWLIEGRFIGNNSKAVGTTYWGEVYLENETITFDSYSLEIYNLMQDSFNQLKSDTSCLVTNNQKLDEKVEYTNDTISSVIEHLLEDLASQNRIIREVYSPSDFDIGF